MHVQKAMETGSMLRLSLGSIRDAFLKQFSSCCTSSHQGDGEGDAGIKTVSIITAFFFMVNYQMVTGFLGIPFAFFHGGLLAGALTLLVVAFVSWTTEVWLLEVMARAQVEYMY